jgi:hypothetical protein
MYRIFFVLIDPAGRVTLNIYVESDLIYWLVVYIAFMRIIVGGLDIIFYGYISYIVPYSTNKDRSVLFVSPKNI